MVRSGRADRGADEDGPVTDPAAIVRCQTIRQPPSYGPSRRAHLDIEHLGDGHFLEDPYAGGPRLGEQLEDGAPVRGAAFPVVSVVQAFACEMGLGGEIQ